MYLLLLGITILILLIIIYFLRFNYNKSKEEKEYLNNHENYQNYDDNELDNFGNLIENGNFSNFKNIKTFVNKNGYNKIIKLRNPGSSNFVLNQKKTDDTFYEFKINCDINSDYIFYFWICIDEYNIEEFNFEKYIKLRIPKKDFNNYLPNFIYNVIKKTTYDDNQNWYYVKVNFSTINNIEDQCFINLNFNNKFKNLYITDLSIYKVLQDAKNFIFNRNLIYFGNALTYQSHNNVWKDLSGNGNDMHFTSIPETNLSSGYIDLVNTRINGFNANEINNQEFTIIMIINKQNDLPKINSIVDDNKNSKKNIFEKVLLSFPGNNRFSFELTIQDDYLTLISDKIRVRSKEKLNYYNKSSLVIIYKDSKINIFNDGINIISQKINKIYFSNNKFTINRNKNVDLYLYSFLIYNRFLENNELRKIREYFITNQDKNFNNLPNILNHSFEDVFAQTNSPVPLIKPFDNISQHEDIKVDTFKNHYDNQDIKIRNSCTNTCLNLCNKFLNKKEPEIDNYKNCITNCKNVLPQCSDFCSEEENNDDSLFCSSDKNDVIVCPKVYKKNNNYYVYIPPNSYYSNMYEGEKSYGSDIEKVRYMYSINFPKCLLPEELQINNGNTQNDSSCPYIINELNPCQIKDCSNVNWNVSNYKDLNINDNCKKAISNYCHINYKYDPNCVCWNPKYKNDKNCIEFKRFFEDPKDYCKPSSFDIKDHPDFNKYIKKDKIPCWGCNLNE